MKDDKAMVGGLGELDGRPVMFIGQQKASTPRCVSRNFGMANPEEYRKALRLMRLAEKFNRPVVTLIDTPGAYLAWKRRSADKARRLPATCSRCVSFACPSSASSLVKVPQVAHSALASETRSS